MSQKYEISEIAHPRYPWLHRIRALREFRPGVRPGDLGGYVQSEENLSQEDVCWIFDDAIACEGCLVDQQAIIADSVVVRGSAFVSGTVAVRGNAIIDDHAILMAGMVRGNAHVAGTAEIVASMESGEAPLVEGHASVYGDVTGAVKVKDTAVILPGVTIDNPTKDIFVVQQDKVTVERNYHRLNGIPQNPSKQQETKRKRRFEPER